MTVQNTESQDNVVESDDSLNTEQVNTDQASVENSNTEEDQKAEQRKKSALGQIKAAQARIDAGETTKEECPAWMLEDLREKAPEVTEEALKEKLKAELRDELEFEQLQKSLPEDLTEEQAEKMNEVIEAEIKLGKSKTEALEYAKFKVGIMSPTVRDERQEAIMATSFPRIVPKKAVKREDESTQYFMDTLPPKYKK